MPEIQAIIARGVEEIRLSFLPRRLLVVFAAATFRGDTVRLQAFIADVHRQRGIAQPPRPQKLILWPDGAPGVMAAGGEETVSIKEEGDHVVSNVHRPSLTVYLPAKHAGVSVIVVPGGGHRELWTDHEGHDIARFLNERGIAAFVLQYRLARAPNSTYTIEGDALNDLKRADPHRAFARRTGRRTRRR